METVNRYNSINDYLDHKLSCIRQGKCIKYHSKDQTCGICWWKGVTRSNNNISRCSRCVQDTNRFNETIKSAREICKFTADCTDSCLWWDWYNNERQKVSKQFNVELVYVRENKNR